MSEFDLDIPEPFGRADRVNGGACEIARRMPFGGSKLFETQAAARAVVASLRYMRFQYKTQKRNIEKHGEVGWRVWKLGNQ